VGWLRGCTRSLPRFLTSGNQPVVITGDIHSSWVHDLKADFNNPTSQIVGTEFVGTSITSDFPAQFIAPVTAALTDNTHTKFFDGAFRGYVRCNLNRDRWQTDFRVVSTILEQNADISTLASFVVEDGRSACVSSIHLWYKPTCIRLAINGMPPSDGHSYS